jgi:Asp-tRNA(Asn)/Glu-tRNA(Gln) amidotransferase B subunit
MPEPNLPPLRVEIKESDVLSDLVSVPEMYRRLPELPECTRQRLKSEHGITLESAIALVVSKYYLIYMHAGSRWGGNNNF